MILRLKTGSDLPTTGIEYVLCKAYERTSFNRRANS